MKLSVCITCLLVLVLVITVTTKVERFGMSPGTLTQLQSTSVPDGFVTPLPRPYFLY